MLLLPPLVLILTPYDEGTIPQAQAINEIINNETYNIMDIKFDKVGNVSAQLTISMTKADYEAEVTKSLKNVLMRVV